MLKGKSNSTNISTKVRHVPNVLNPYTKPYATKQERSSHAAGLRVLADWVEGTSFPIPALCFNNTYQAALDISSTWIDDEGFVKRAGSAARLIGGKVDKGTVAGTDFKLERDFGGGVVLRYRISREAVCTPREEVVEEERYMPVDEDSEADLRATIEAAEEALDQLDREYRTVPVTKTVYICPDSLLAPIPKPETEAQVEPSSEEVPW